MTTKLRLWRGDSDGQTHEEPPRTLRFPVEAAAAMPAPTRVRRGGSAVAGRVRPSIGRGPTPAGDDDLVRHIEETLDRVQARFDDLKQQLSAGAVYGPRLTFPRPDDHSPRPAA